MKKVRADELRGLIIEILKEREIEDSDVIADHFVEAELRGHSSHGIQRLIPLVKGIELGTISKRLRYEIIRQSGNSMWIDAKASIGIVLWTKLVEREFTSDPISIIAVKNSSHIGFLGYYTEKLGKRG